MEFSEYENIEIFNKTQSFSINKCENQTLRQFKAVEMKTIEVLLLVFISKIEVICKR